MGPKARGKFPHLIQELLNAPVRFSLFQALYLLESNLESTAVSGDALHRYLVTAPAADLTFPEGEIRRCALDDNGRFRLEVSALGLCGVDSPLPQFFNDITVQDSPESEALRAFLEIFNRRLYQLLYLAWKKMNLHHNTAARSSLYCRYLKAMHGGSTTYAELGRYDYAGIMGGHIRNGQALAGMLEDFFATPVALQENIPTWIDLPEQATVGDGFALGDDTILGGRLMDVTSKVLIRLGPMPIAEATELFPGRNGAKTLSRLIGEYLDPTMQFDLELVIQPEKSALTVLGANHAVLGWTTCIGEPGDGTHCLRLPGENIRGGPQPHSRADGRADAPLPDWPDMAAA